MKEQIPGGRQHFPVEGPGGHQLYLRTQLKHLARNKLLVLGYLFFMCKSKILFFLIPFETGYLILNSDLLSQHKTLFFPVYFPELHFY